MTDFADLGHSEKRYLIEGALPAVLRSLTHTASTSIVAARLARALGARPDEVAGPLLKLAHAGHPHALRGGETFKRFGRTMQRYVWTPLADDQPTEHALVWQGKLYASQAELEAAKLAAETWEV